MKFTSTLLVAAQVLSVFALPAPQATTELTTTTDTATSADSTTTVDTSVTDSATATTTVSESTTSTETSASATATSGAGEEEKENEVEQQGQFNRIIRVTGGNVKVDTLFPAGVNGVFEVELQSQQARNIRVRENRRPAAAPQGFTALEPVSYIVEMSGNTRGLALQKIDYIRNANSTVDISQGRVARFCREAQAFVFGEGELEFEAEENELTLKVDNLRGEWAFFVPTATAEAGAEAGTGTETGESAAETTTVIDVGAGAGTGAVDPCGPGTLCRALLDAARSVVGAQ
ncbi:hypothetical protein VTJ04DRAFT_7405 [Mycothermus thermophilus]|uniref:uncharacterized protein n=1 Tax=Humicola insolens TaxID=85995 RepID=UPI003743AD8D